MFHISSVHIDGFWGSYFIKTNIEEDVTIFIGKNGTGKTTFINILLSVLNFDIKSLISMDFKKIQINLHQGNLNQTIVVKKGEQENSPENIFVTIGDKAFDLPMGPREIEILRTPRMRYRTKELFSEVRREIESLVKISSLSVNRLDPEVQSRDDYERPSRGWSSLLDIRLDDLIKRLTSYQLGLAEEENKVSLDFQKSALVTMLYDEEFDQIQLHEVKKIEFFKEKENLARAFKEMNIYDKTVKSRIEKHISILEKSVENIVEKKNEKGFLLNDIMPLPLLKRTQHIINLFAEAEKKKQEITSPLSNFLEILREFFDEKRVELSKSGGLVFFSQTTEIPLQNLSSGEKQLLIFLIETLVQKDEPFIFIADEPELSLHIEWQSQLIKAIKRLNKNSQVIVATHSPEIAGEWKSRIKNMGSIIHEQA